MVYGAKALVANRKQAKAKRCRSFHTSALALKSFVASQFQARYWGEASFRRSNAVWEGRESNSWRKHGIDVPEGVTVTFCWS